MHIPALFICKILLSFAMSIFLAKQILWPIDDVCVPPSRIQYIIFFVALGIFVGWLFNAFHFAFIVGL